MGFSVWTDAHLFQGGCMRHELILESVVLLILLGL